MVNADGMSQAMVDFSIALVLKKKKVCWTCCGIHEHIWPKT